MNPIERAVAKSEKAAAANNALEQLSRRQKIADGPRSTIAGLPHGETAHFGSPGATGHVSVTYHERQSYGDNNQPVRGATTGEYTVSYPNGKTDTFSHGPHATTAAAARRGANPNARGSAASAAHDAVVRHLAKSQVFNHQGI